MTRQRSSLGLALIALASIVVAVTGTGSAAVPSQGRIAWGETVTWSGELHLGGGQVGNTVGDMSVCPPGACDDFLLEINVAPTPDPDRVRFVQIEFQQIQGADPFDVDLVVYPPGADRSRDWTQYPGDIARLLDPQPGAWLIQARCFGLRACVSGVTYQALATTGELDIPRAVAHRADAVGVTSEEQLPEAHLHQVGANAFEPTIGINADGSAIYYQALTQEQIPKVLRSTDGGEDWTNVSPRLANLYRHPVTFDPFIHVDHETGRVFTVDLLVALVCNELSFTDDGGAAWRTSGTCHNAPDHHSVFTGPPVSSRPIGYPNLVYSCVNAASIATVCSKSLDGGLTFVPTGLPAYTSLWPVDNCAGGLSGHGIVGPDGSVYLPRGFCGQPFIAMSRDEGATWQQVQVADIGVPGELAEFPRRSHESSVAADELGTLYYTWVAHDRLPYLAISRDGGVTWSPPVMIAPPGVNEAALATIDVAAPGEVAIAYMGTEHSPGGPPFPGEGECSLESPVSTLCAEPPEYEGVPWNGYITVTTGALDPDPVFFSATINDPADPLVRGACSGFRCEGAGDFFDVVIGPEGTVWAAFVDTCVADRCYRGLFGEGVLGELVRTAS